MNLIKPQIQSPITIGPKGHPFMAVKAWADFFSSLYRQVKLLTTAAEGYGTTADRPTEDLWIGRSYFDTTLGKPVWCDDAAAGTWVDATGTTV